MHKSETTATQPTCLFVAELTMTRGQHCFLHSHACTEIVWYRGCAGWLPQGAERLRYGDGDIGVYQPGVLHGDECEKRGTQMCVGVTGAGAEELLPGVWHADESTRTAFEQLHRELSRHDDRRQDRLNLLSGWLVLELGRQLEAHAAAGPREPSHVTATRRLFDTRFAEPLSIAGIARELSIHPDYLRQLFIKWTGETPMRYLIRKRMESACDLLRLNQENTRRIAARVGIPNPYYFSRLFRNRFGLTPTQYRARYASARELHQTGRVAASRSTD
jgi:AraC-like DNA-binding protein